MDFEIVIEKGLTPTQAAKKLTESGKFEVCLWEGDEHDLDFLDRQLRPEPRASNANGYKITGAGIHGNEEMFNVSDILEADRLFPDFPTMYMTLTELMVLVEKTSEFEWPALFKCLIHQGVVCPHSQFMDGGLAGVAIRSGELRILWVDREKTRGMAFVQVTEVS